MNPVHQGILRNQKKRKAADAAESIRQKQLDAGAKVLNKDKHKKASAPSASTSTRDHASEESGFSLCCCCPRRPGPSRGVLQPEKKAKATVIDHESVLLLDETKTKDDVGRDPKAFDNVAAAAVYEPRTTVDENDLPSSATGYVLPSSATAWDHINSTTSLRSSLVSAAAARRSRRSSVPGSEVDGAGIFKSKAGAGDEQVLLRAETAAVTDEEDEDDDPPVVTRDDLLEEDRAKWDNMRSELIESEPNSEIEKSNKDNTGAKNNIKPQNDGSSLARAESLDRLTVATNRDTSFKKTASPSPTKILSPKPAKAKGLAVRAAGRTTDTAAAAGEEDRDVAGTGGDKLAASLFYPTPASATTSSSVCWNTQAVAGGSGTEEDRDDPDELSASAPELAPAARGSKRFRILTVTRSRSTSKHASEEAAPASKAGVPTSQEPTRSPTVVARKKIESALLTRFRKEVDVENDPYSPISSEDLDELHHDSEEQGALLAQERARTRS